MNIRQAQPNDVPRLVKMDKKAYGTYGANEKYFRKKLGLQNTKVLVAENDTSLEGFVVFETLEQDQIPEDFRDLHLKDPMQGNWAHIIAFTTKTNYRDIVSDRLLLHAVEEMAKSMGCYTICVPLSVDHPFISHNVLSFGN